MAKSPAWQRKAGKNPSGGLNAKGRASYKGGTAKTANDPDSRINKALRKWNCNCVKERAKVLSRK